MDFAIDTLIRVGNVFCTMQQVSPRQLDSNYIEGAIVWQVDGVEILGESHWDLVDQLWVYIISGIEKVLALEEYSTFFPDQPLSLAFRPLPSGLVEVKVGSERHVLNTDVFCVSLTEGAGKFFTQMVLLVPNKRSFWESQLTVVDGITRRLEKK